MDGRKMTLEEPEAPATIKTNDVVGKDGFLHRHGRRRLLRRDCSLSSRGKSLMHRPNNIRELLRSCDIVGNVSQYDLHRQIDQLLVQEIRLPQVSFSAYHNA